MDEGRAARLLALSHSCFSARKFDLFYFFYFVIRATMLLALSHSCFSARKFDLFYFFYLYVFLEYDGVYILVYHVVKNNERQDECLKE